MLVGLALGVVGAALPWLTLGGVERSAFRLIRSARELELLEQRRQQLAVQSLLFFPAFVGTVVILFSLGRRRLGGTIGIASGVVLIVAGLVGRSVAGGLGPFVTAFGGVCAAAGGACCLLRR